MFVGEQLVFDAGRQPGDRDADRGEHRQNQIQACSRWPTLMARPIMALGGFSSGVVPTSLANGSTGSVLKLYGDLNSDGK